MIGRPFTVDAKGLGSFEASMDAFVDLVDRRADLLVQGVAATVFNEIQTGGQYSEGTPVANPKTWKQERPHVGGFARASWQGGVGVMPSGAIETFSPGDPEAAAAAEASAARNQEIAMTAVAGDEVHFVNDAPYIGRLEFGWSQQAPVGMVRETLRHLQPIVDEVGAHVRSMP